MCYVQQLHHISTRLRTLFQKKMVNYYCQFYKKNEKSKKNEMKVNDISKTKIMMVT